MIDLCPTRTIDFLIPVPSPRKARSVDRNQPFEKLADNSSRNGLSGRVSSGNANQVLCGDFSELVNNGTW